MAGGTVFHFLEASPREALERAVAAANGRDVRVGGGPTVVRDYLKAGLVDRLHVAITPILLGQLLQAGDCCWQLLRGKDPLRSLRIFAQLRENLAGDLAKHDDVGVCFGSESCQHGTAS